MEFNSNYTIKKDVKDDVKEEKENDDNKVRSKAEIKYDMFGLPMDDKEDNIDMEYFRF